MKKNHVNIPIFIPELACPFQCIFCNQKKITGKIKQPGESEIKTIIESYLSTIQLDQTDVEIAFFGGSFTGLPLREQEKYLKMVLPYFKQGISGIRISTRPDYIHSENLQLLKKNGVKTIELGAQSFDDEVLKNSGRGHCAQSTMESAKIIKGMGFQLGLQMMIGLPGDNLDKALQNAQTMIYLNADFTRIYPVLVIKNTALENLYLRKEYFPLSLSEAVSQSAELLKLFELAGIPVIRIGLHPSEGLMNRTELIAGPFHPSFRELVETAVWKEIFANYLKNGPKGSSIEVFVSPEHFNYAIGYQGENKSYLNRFFKRVAFVKDEGLKKRDHFIRDLV